MLTESRQQRRARERAASRPSEAPAGLGQSQTTFERTETPLITWDCDATNGSWTPPESDRVRRRRELYQLREWWRPRSERDRARRCGRVRVSLEPTLTVRDGAWNADGTERPRSGAWGGVETCASVWSCPVCSVRVRSDRARAIVALDEWARAEGWQVSMWTGTIRHALGNDLEHLRRAMADAFARVQRLTAWRSMMSPACPQCPPGTVAGVDCDHAQRGAFFVRALEVTHGKNGWHPHFHVLLVSPVSVEAQAHQLGEDWRAAVTHVLGIEHAPSVEHGADWREIEAGEYISKLDLAMGLELTDASDAKTTKGATSRKPSELLRDAHAHQLAARAARAAGDLPLAAVHEHAQRADTHRFRSYESAMIGARLHTATQGLLKLWQTIADEQRDEVTDVVCVLPMPAELFDLLRDVPQGLVTIAAASELPDTRGTVATYLRSLGVYEIRARGRDEPRVLDGPEWADRWECMLDSMDYATWLAADYCD